MSDLSPTALRRLIDLARPLVDDPQPPLDLLGKYELLRELGRGGMGTVYEAAYVMGGRRWRVALKLLADGGFASGRRRRRFWREAMIATRLTHPHIVRLLEVNSAYLVMQLIDGPNLAVARPGPAEVVRLLAQAADAVAAAHRQGVVHRDLKPANLLLCRQTGDVFVTDFGLGARVAGDGDHRAIVGTPGFMAPEQARGGVVGPPADVYSLGATLAALVPAPDPALAALIARCRADDPAARPTPRALGDALRAQATGASSA